MPIRAQTLQREWAQGSYILNYYRKFDNQKDEKTDELRCTVRQFSDQTLQLECIIISELVKKKKGGHTIDMCLLDMPHKHSSENK